ncbi:hypothetical protein ZWY2020_057718, partial [Hordeum vulgare]
NLSSNGLDGDISSSFANLKALKYLNLSNNNLTGSIPDVLSELQSLTDIDLSDNQLNGSIPYGLLKRIQDGSLNLRHSNNPNLCTGDNSCQLVAKRKNKLAIYVVVPLLVIVAQILTRIHHKNLVAMIGYCKDGEYMALVYEYMSQGTLQMHIAGIHESLPWRQRLRIALESAQGLEYLHKGATASYP